VTASRRREFPGGEYGLPCILIIRRLEQGQRHDSAKLNELLREEGVST
jgi:2,3,4,5-tetrahydropyridine-2-carboxylate N-succinyltransferase